MKTFHSLVSFSRPTAQMYFICFPLGSKIWIFSKYALLLFQKEKQEGGREVSGGKDRQTDRQTDRQAGRRSERQGNEVYALRSSTALAVHSASLSVAQGSGSSVPRFHRRCLQYPLWLQTQGEELSSPTGPPASSFTPGWGSWQHPPQMPPTTVGRMALRGCDRCELRQ